MTNPPLTFLASFPNISSAIRVAGDGGARILLDIPEDELPSIARLLLMRGIVLRVTVEPETLTLVDATEDHATTEDTERSPAQVDKRRAAKRRN